MGASWRTSSLRTCPSWRRGTDGACRSFLLALCHRSSSRSAVVSIRRFRSVLDRSTCGAPEAPSRFELDAAVRRSCTTDDRPSGGSPLDGGKPKAGALPHPRSRSALHAQIRRKGQSTSRRRRACFCGRRQTIRLRLSRLRSWRILVIVRARQPSLRCSPSASRVSCRRAGAVAVSLSRSDRSTREPRWGVPPLTMSRRPPYRATRDTRLVRWLVDVRRDHVGCARCELR